MRGGGGVTHRQWKNTRLASESSRLHLSPAEWQKAAVRAADFAHISLRNHLKCGMCKQGVSASPPPHTEHSLDIYEAEWGDIKAKLHVDIFNIKSYFSLFLVVRTCRPKQSPECVTADAFNDIISMAGSNGNKGTCCLFMGMALRAAVCAVIHRL